jgi:hypothetical protein
MAQKRIALLSSTGLFQFRAKPADRVCVDCISGYIETNPGMTTADWIAADVSDFDAECCDACDCVPAAEGKRLALVVRV